MKKNLKNTIRTVYIEGYSFRPANNKKIYVFTGRKMQNLPNTMSLVEKIEAIYKTLPSYSDIYMMRILYIYHNRKNKRVIYKKRTIFHFVNGSIVPKQEAVDYFNTFAPHIAKDIENLSSEKVFRIHYETQALNKNHNYDLITKK